jgi:predicted SprT family Zn-dependent metalloprotease
MGVNDNDGHLIVNKRYLNSGSKEDIYLDIIHELCHVKQHKEGRDLFDPNYDYADRPAEIEAYRYAILEAKRIGLSETRIRQYLKTEWMNTEVLDRLIRNMNVNLKEP